MEKAIGLKEMELEELLEVVEIAAVAMAWLMTALLSAAFCCGICRSDAI